MCSISEKYFIDGIEDGMERHLTESSSRTAGAACPTRTSRFLGLTVAKVKELEQKALAPA